ncbi:DUF7146 domain-containing protein [Methylococcus capsulatus]|uniref:DUF7146 domain-containing protein n=1 Tax=Methylococcus capsulatus TaxID=414 RepID=UPI001C52A61E|nr:toprim domain-containing protein [Methylococcus capsulatus]QXP89651.1 toprim domain-containing protein [Methylococcus capsulatus]
MTNNTTASGRWLEILGALAPSLEPALRKPGAHVPCPVHGGVDGFRLFRDCNVTGGGICNTCGAFATGLALLQWVNGWSRQEAAREVAAHLGGSRIFQPASRPARRSMPPRNTQAKRIWETASPLTSSAAVPARLYLARRGLSGIRLDGIHSLRAHPRLPYHEDGAVLGFFPAIVALVTGASGKPVALHRTYLTDDGRKAPVASPKKVLKWTDSAVLSSGSVRLFRPGAILALTEGLETALAVRLGTGLPVWCALNAGNLRSFQPPPEVARVLVFGDRDRPTPQHPLGHGQEAGQELVTRLWKEGIKAGLMIPASPIPPREKSLDWADILTERGPAAFPIKTGSTLKSEGGGR